MVLEAPKRILEALGTLLGSLERALEDSREYFGNICELFGSYFGAWEAFLKRFPTISKNNLRRCKVFQKSMFGGTAIDAKISLEDKLGSLLTLSWLVRKQIKVERDKLTLLGCLRDTKLELKGALGALKEASRCTGR